MARAGDFISLGGLSLLEFITRHDARGKILGAFIHPEGIKLQMERLKIGFKKRSPALNKREKNPAIPQAGKEPTYLGDKGKNPPHFNGEMNCPAYDVNGAINIAKKYLETLNEQPVVVLGTPKMYRFDGCSFVA